ncbi:hypothetical protein [Nocardia sp. NPDC050793]|uniref:hypothetical protein n=1 Tax=Nocardia sp. NPDC050793 TaxID=3155159 RepID=UPI0033CDA72C
MRARRLLIVLALAAMATACDPYSRGPGNAEVLQSTGLTVEQAEYAVFDNLLALSPDPARSYGAEVTRHGCATNASARTVGPPWKLSVGDRFADPSPGLVDATEAALKSMAERGFTMPVDKGLTGRRGGYRRDDRGFEVGFEVRDTDGKRYLSVVATTPCAAEKSTGGGPIPPVVDAIRLATRKAVHAFGVADPVALRTVACGKLGERVDFAVPADERERLRQAMAADAETRGPGRVVEITSYRWLGDPMLPSAASAEVTVRYQRHPDIRYRAEYRDWSGGAWRLCAFDPI